MADELILDAPSWSSDDEILEAETPPRRRRYSSEGSDRRRLRACADGSLVRKSREMKVPDVPPKSGSPSNPNTRPRRQRSRSACLDDSFSRKMRRKDKKKPLKIDDDVGPKVSIEHEDDIAGLGISVEDFDDNAFPPPPSGFEDQQDGDVVFVKAVENARLLSEEITICDDVEDDDVNDYKIDKTDANCEEEGDDDPVNPWVQEIVIEEYRTVHFEFASSSSSSSSSDKEMVEDDDIWTAFCNFGPVEKLRFTEGGGGNVVFEEVDAVDRCMVGRVLTINGVDILLRRLPVSLDDERYDAGRVQISGIFHLSEATIVDYFSSYGLVEKVQLYQARGFAFLTFANYDAAEKSLLQQFHPIEGVVVEVRPAFKHKPKDPQQFRPRPPGEPHKFDVGPRGRLRPGEFLVIHPFPRPVPMKVKIKEEEEGYEVNNNAPPRKRVAASSLVSVKNEKSEMAW